MGPQEWTIIGVAVAGYTVGFGTWMALIYADIKAIKTRLNDGSEDIEHINATLSKHGLHLHKHDVQFAQLHKGHE